MLLFCKWKYLLFCSVSRRSADLLNGSSTTIHCHWSATPKEKQITALTEWELTGQEFAACELLAEKQPSFQFVTPKQFWGHAGVFCFEYCGSDDGHGASDGWQLDSARDALSTR